MKLTVLTTFRDKDNFNLAYSVGQEIEIENEERAERIISLGYCAKVEAAENTAAPTVEEKPAEPIEEPAPSAEKPEEEEPVEPSVETQEEREMVTEEVQEKKTRKSKK